MNQFSGIAPADEIERFQYGYSLTRPMMLDPKYNNCGKKTYYEEYRDWETDRKSTRLNSSHRL